MNVVGDLVYMALLGSSTALALRGRGRLLFHVGGVALAMLAVASARTTAEVKWPLLPAALNILVMGWTIALRPWFLSIRKRLMEP